MTASTGVRLPAPSAPAGFSTSPGGRLQPLGWRLQAVCLHHSVRAPAAVPDGQFDPARGLPCGFVSRNWPCQQPWMLASQPGVLLDAPTLSWHDHPRSPGMQSVSRSRAQSFPVNAPSSILGPGITQPARSEQRHWLLAPLLPQTYRRRLFEPLCAQDAHQVIILAH